MIDWSAKFWELEIETVRACAYRPSGRSGHLVTARHAAPLMLQHRRGLIVGGLRRPPRRLSRPAALRPCKKHGEPPRLRHGLGPPGNGRDGCSPYARDSLRSAARAWPLRRLRGQLARRDRQGSILRRVGVTILRRPGRRSRSPPTRWCILRQAKCCSPADFALAYGFTDVDGRRPAFHPMFDAGRSRPKLRGR